MVLARIPAGLVPAMLAIFPVSVSAQQQFDHERCTAAVQAFQKEHGIVGLSVAVAYRGKVIYARGFGLSDVENDVKVSKDTVFRLASISKPVAAVAVMQLWERGKLDLDKTVQEYVPTFPKKKWPLTCRHLLSHIGGVRHYKRGEILSAKRYRTVESALVIFQDDPLLFEPGTRYRYTTYGYNVLGAVVARVAKQPFKSYLKENIFEPAGMTGAQADDSQKIIKHRAQGYRRTALGVLTNSAMVDTSNKIPGGGLISTPTDLVKFASALMAGKLLKPETVQKMWTRARLKDGKEIGYGLGFQVVATGDAPLVGHGGSQPRVRTSLMIRPKEQAAVAVMCNLEGTRPAILSRRLLRQLLGKRLTPQRQARRAASQPIRRR